MLRPLFSIAPMLKSDTATMLNTSRSYSRPKRSSSQRMDALERVHGPGAAALLAGLDVDASDRPCARTRVVKVDASDAKLPPTSANR